MHVPTENNSCKLQRESDKRFYSETQKTEASMTRFAALFGAATLLAAPAIAGTYSAKPIAAPAATKIIGKDISWTCGAGGCQGSTAASRPLVLCQDLAKRTGRLQSFVADGRALSAAELDKCNASAKDGAPKALANAN